jgi:uncharacterized hydrophobic protein (TIGR00271 family)
METNNQNNATSNSSQEGIKKDFTGLIGNLKKFFKELLDIRSNTDQQATITAIIEDIPFKGHTSWILICSIFIASVGLNANSTAVVIGAMLISPLMGPILGMGMSLAINDVVTLRRSIKNFGVMVFLSILTAFLFFKFFPLRDESSELLARTAPDIRDVFIAFFGGLALVIARAKKGTMASVIFGVAIATALMPPLCTVGFGLAIGKWDFAGGAMYLFIINTIFIGLATFLVLKLLRFPMVRYANSARRRFIGRMASLLAVIVMIPAGYTFYKVWKQSTFENQAQQFINDHVASYQFSNGSSRFLEDFADIEYNDGENSTIELVFMGDEAIPSNVIDTWKLQKNEYPRLQTAELKVIQGANNNEQERFNYVSELYEAKKAEIANKDQRIRILEEELATLTKAAGLQIPFQEISKEAKINYDHLQKLGFSYTISTDFNTMDTIPVFETKWDVNAPAEDVAKNTLKLTEWLKLKLNNKRIVVRRIEE